MDPTSDQHPGSSLVSFVGSQGLQEPFFPNCLSPKDLCFLPVDGMRSLFDMHGNSILRILVLDRPSVLSHTDSQRPPSLSNESDRKTRDDGCEGCEVLNPLC